MAPGTRGASSCEFALGFAELRSQVGAHVAGECVEDQQTDISSGDAFQRATGGTFVWRRSTNSISFTDGHRTWTPGSRGPHVRLNTQRFAWEVVPRLAPSAMAAANAGAIGATGAISVAAFAPALWAPGNGTPSPLWLGDAPLTAWHVSDLPAINSAARNVSATFRATQKCYAGLTGPLCGFSAGADYDAIYARDTSTLLRFAKYTYGHPFLAAAVEETLFLQYEDAQAGEPAGPSPAPFPGHGALSGVIDFDSRRGKALVTSDEETSTIHSAYLIYRSAGGVPWLHAMVNGRSVLERLNLAMEWLLTYRADPTTGLIVRPHTTDWGDVDLADTGSAIGRSGAVPDLWTASIFDQAWTYRALRELAAMNAAAGDAGRAAALDERAAWLRTAAHELLWLDGPGHYRTHAHLDERRHAFNEDDMVSVANAVAAYTGLADEYQSARLFVALERARVQSGSPTPGVSIFPAYPSGTFAHPKMDEGRYQNGGLWDWWGGVQVTAELTRGEAELGLAHLAAVAAAWQQHPDDVIEWRAGPRRCFQRTPGAACAAPPLDLTQPALRGSGHYVGAAATVSEAIVAGLFGLELALDGFAVSPRLGARSGAARVHQPASGWHLGAEQEHDDGALTVRYATNHPGPGRLSVRLPSSVPPGAATVDGRDALADLRIFTIGHDTYASLDTAPSGSHELRLAW